MTETAPPATVPKRGWRLGLVALLAAIVAPVWLAGGFTLGVFSATDRIPDGLNFPVYIVISAGSFLVPALFLVAVVFGIVALVIGARRGKILGGIALGLVLLAILGIIIYVAAAFGAFQ